MKTRVILTIGTNELPCLIAGRRLYEACRDRDGEAPDFLVLYSKEVRKRMERVRSFLAKKLQVTLASNSPEWRELEIDAVDPQSIFRRVLDEVSRKPGYKLGYDAYHLHHTGGTTAMGVYTMQALLDFPGREYRVESSYLDAGGRRLRSMELDGLPSDERREWDLTLEQLAELRGYRTTFYKPRPAQDNRPVRAESGSQRSIRTPDPEAVADAHEKVRKWLSQPQPTETSGNFNGREFELFVNEELARVLRTEGDGTAERVYTKVYFARSDPAKEDFEIDVIAVLGYELVVISCTTSDTPAKRKVKVVEAWHRARQIGGDQARVILACSSMSEADHDDLRRPSFLQSELRFETSFRDEEFRDEPMRIMGLEDLRQFGKLLQDYVTDADHGLNWKIP